MVEPRTGRPTDYQLDALADAVVEGAAAVGIGILMATDEGPDSTILYANDAAARLLGLSMPELLEQPAAILFERMRLFRQSATGRRKHEPVEDIELRSWPPQCDIAVEDGAGNTRFLEVTCSAASRDGRRAVVALVVDASERRRVEQALLRSEERFKHLVEVAPEGVIIMSGGDILFANPTSARLFGVTSEAALVGQEVTSFIHPDDVAKFERRAQRVVTEGRKLGPQEYRIVTPQNAAVYLEFSSVAIEHEGRQAVLCLVRDVTERKQIESQLLQADRLGALGMLAGGMAHAINNPLTYVLLNLEDVSRRLPDVPSGRSPLSEALARLREAYQGSERIASIVRQMRAFTRPEEQPRGPVHLRRVLEAAVAMVGNEIRHRGRLVVDFQDVPPVQASSARLEHVFLNLLLHVAQELPEGQPDGEIRLVLKADPPDRVLVEVSDFGAGIEPAALEHAFDPFFSGGAMAERVGLGLALCQSIVSSLGGTMEAESEVGRGTTFRVFLPAHEVALDLPPESRGRGPQIALAPSRRARIMVVDDDPGVVSALRLMLEDEHDVTSVSNGPEALRMLVRDATYDVVFCDLMMPEVSGKDLYEALQLNCPGHERRLVFMTGGAFTPEASRFLSKVPNPRIEKPFDMDSLRTLLRTATQ